MESGILVDEQRTLLEEIISGLNSKNKYLPSKLFYDEEGSKLFDEICELEEYYPTRTELLIMEENIDEICSYLNVKTLFIEFGSGSSLKTKMILDNVEALAGYIPIDISESHLEKSANILRENYPQHDVYILAADYTQPLEFPSIVKEVKKKVAYFPGSTIGNFTHEESVKFFRIVADEIGTGGGLLIGVDLVKDKNVLEAAYNDSKGVTAKFNLNILSHINNRFNADFKLDSFEHYSFFNDADSRIEMYLVSKCDQKVKLPGHEFIVKKGERILTEYSHKFTLDSFKQLAAESFNVDKVWADKNNYFSIQYLTAL